jgi:hypothetical protein
MVGTLHSTHVRPHRTQNLDAVQRERVSPLFFFTLRVDPVPTILIGTAGEKTSKRSSDRRQRNLSTEIARKMGSSIIGNKVAPMFENWKHEL